MFDITELHERAAIKEYDAGMSRFQAETEAAAEIGKKRWEIFTNANSKRNTQVRGNQPQQAQRNTKNAMPTMQPHQTEKER